jgi:phosphate-selective porin
MDDDGDPTTPGDPLPPLIGQGMYVQAGVVVTGQHKRIDNLLPEVKGWRVRDSAVELSARYEQFRLGAEDLPGNGIRTFVGGVNWIVVQHLRLYVAGVYQRFDAKVPEIPEARSWGVTSGFAGYFLRRAGSGD